MLDAPWWLRNEKFKFDLPLCEYDLPLCGDDLLLCVDDLPLCVWMTSRSVCG